MKTLTEIRFDDLTGPLTVPGHGAVAEALTPENFDEQAEERVALLDAGDVRVSCDFERASVSNPVGRGPAAYTREVARIPVMDRAEEIRFAMGLELLWRRLQKARRDVGLPQEEVEEWPESRAAVVCPPESCTPALRERLERRTSELVLARNEMIERNLHIVFRLLDRYRHVNVPEEDLIQEANESLFRAVENFDFRRGVRFKTYASYWVNQAFLNAIYNQSRTVRVPAYIQKAMKKIQDVSQDVEGGTYNADSLAEEADLDVDLVRNTLRGNRFTLSLNRTADSEDGSEMVDLLPTTEEARLPGASEEEAMLKRYLDEAVRALSQREQTVLQMRYGLDGQKVSTLAEVGRVLGVSLERVRQIQRAALDKLRGGRKGPVLKQFA